MEMLPHALWGGTELVQTGCLLACLSGAKGIPRALWHEWPLSHLHLLPKTMGELRGWEVGGSQRSGEMGARFSQWLVSENLQSQAKAQHWPRLRLLRPCPLTTAQSALNTKLLARSFTGLSLMGEPVLDPVVASTPSCLLTAAVGFCIRTPGT